ncbi:hypothetical protein jhhlp_001813 [Lomentospora prolificans]|uniref:Proteasome assembly chaperone 3 n=1 Tax=Lomentospora prolificans TaxID=41688 RepID=A0A2N3NH38_9PEZI|nr:hypothetical protein jhhlp_001813 [Lomentospora prolificans]
MAGSSSTVIELSFPLPRALDTRVYAHLTLREKSVVVFLTTSTTDDLSTPPSMVFHVNLHLYAELEELTALQRFNPNQPISTALYTQESNLEFATRIAKLLARRTQLPTYVGSSLNLSNMGMGGTPEEEMEAFRKVIEVILDKTQHVSKTSDGATANANGAASVQA